MRELAQMGGARISEYLVGVYDFTPDEMRYRSLLANWLHCGPDGTVLETLRRNELWSVQTPQVFRRKALARALAVEEAELATATDDASLIERAGGRVILVGAEADNLKVTTPVDLRLAELLLAERRAQGPGNPA